MKNKAASELGKLSVKKRFKGKSKKQISRIMAKVRRGSLSPVSIPQSLDDER